MKGELGIMRWLHTEICVSDVDRSRAWYERMLGLEIVGGKRLRTVGLVAGVALALQSVGQDAAGQREVTPALPGQIVGFALSVEDVDRCYEIAQREDSVCVGEPVGLEDMAHRSFTIRDPDGLPIRLVDQETPVTANPIRPGVFEVSHWLYVQVRVVEAERSIDWYQRMLGFKMVNDLRFSGPVYEASTGIEGVRIRLVQGFVGGVSMELVHLTSDVPDVAKTIEAGGSIPAFTIGVRDVVSCYELAKQHGVVSEGPPASFPPTPYHSMFIHDPDGTRIDLCDFEALTLEGGASG